MPIVGRSLLAMSVATAIVAFAVAGLSQERNPFMAAGNPTADMKEQTGETGDDGTAEAALHVRVQLPSSTVPGTSRQVRLGVDDRPINRRTFEQVTSTAQMFVIELNIVAAEGADGMIWITPSRVLVHRDSVPWTRFDMTVRRDAPCGSALGELRVRVRDLTEDRETATTSVALPPVICVDPPTQAAASVHDTDTDCGGTVQQTRRVPRRAAAGAVAKCRLPRSPRPVIREPAEEPADDDESGDAVESDADGVPADSSATPEHEDSETSDNGDPGLDVAPDEPTPPDDSDLRQGDEDEESARSPATTQPSGELEESA